MLRLTALMLLALAALLVVVAAVGALAPAAAPAPARIAGWTWDEAMDDGASQAALIALR